MEDGHYQGPAKRPRLDAPVESLLNPMSATALDSNLISYCNIAQSVPQTGILDPGPWPSAIHAVYPSQQNDYHPSKHHGELAMPQNDFHGIVPGDVFGHSLTGLENHTLDTGEWVRQFEPFQCMVSAEEMSLSIPNPPTRDHQGALNGSTIEENTIICFGMCAGIPGECEVSIRRDPTPLFSQLAVNLETAREITCPSVAGFKGSISTQYGQLLQAILDEASVRIQVTCILDEQNIGVRKSGGLLPQLIPCSLSITLYGPKQLFEELGTFFQDYDIYLQDPLNCDLNVRYCNPHRLSSMELSLCPMTYDLKTNILEAFDIQAVSHHSELLDMLDPQEDLSEAAQPSEIQTQLERHQKQALNFMLQREQGWAFDSSRGDLWGWKKATRGRFFINMVSGDHQLEEPRQFFGGIIADPMGLGKTLTMISLVAANVREYHAGNFGLEESAGKLETNKTTLVVVPPPLLDTWEEQLSEHVMPGGLSWRRHHGKSRLLGLSELKRLDIILTTYHTISAEWKNGKQEDQSILFSTQWKRLILDEAHFIRNSSSQMAKAICSVPAAARWAVTGTPIQNRLGDLAALFKFLDVDPYGDIKRFDADITHLWKTGESKQAVERLKRLSRCLILRRPKTTINLPARRDLRCPVNFAPDERTLYENIKSQAIAHFAEATTNHDRGETSQSIKFVNVIQQINTLRMICNLGLHYSSRHDIKPTEYQNNSSDVLDWSSIAQQAFNFQCEITSIICQRCKSSLDITERLFSGSGNHFVNSPLFSQCLRFICSDCVQHSRGEYSCGHNPPHLFSPVSLNGSILEESILIPAHLAVSGGVTSTALPSKVTSLLKQLKAQPSDVKSVVFSTWRMTLDVVESGLKQAQIPCLRYDGKVPQRERQSIIEKFRNDPTIPVLLLTLSCGAVGLTLTEASYAYLMEPHWNPTVEEQALARIHRLGQKKEVTTIRFYIKDTFEERVMEVQRSKEDLAGTLFSSDNNTQSGNATRLERLCSLL